MNVKSLLAKPFANFVYNKIKKSRETAVDDQQYIFKQLIKAAKNTQFGREHDFEGIQEYADFKTRVPVKDYEQIRHYIDRIKEGQQNVLWRGRPVYFAKTSGTTSGVKYIPITKDSLPNHINTARDALLCYMAETGNTSFANGKMIFLSGSPELERVGGIPTGRLSGIVNHHVPPYLRKNQLPSYTTNCIEDWETKLDKIVAETIQQDLTLISGIPPWMQMYFDRLTSIKQNKVADIFKNFSILVYGGVNFEPYRARLFDTIGKKIDSVETFPASEGFFAFQDSQQDEGLLLNTNSGIFFEFIPVQKVFDENPTRLSLADVQVGENYCLIVNSNAGLWSYNVGDMVKFVSTAPYRLLVTGRVKHFISAFGEHVIAEEVEFALMEAARQENIQVIEFTVAPYVAQQQGASYHEWFVEFENRPSNLESFALKVDENLRRKNLYYDDLISGSILQTLQLRPVRKNTFIDYMKSIGKLGGQNKLPRLSNDRKIADVIAGDVENE
jgi:hypothetical protein